MDITLIYFNKEKKRDIKPDINALMNQETDCNYQVIVVDNCSKNPYLKNIEDMPLQLINIDHKSGWINLMNLAIEQAKYDILAITDSTVSFQKTGLIASVRISGTVILSVVL